MPEQAVLVAIADDYGEPLVFGVAGGLIVVDRDLVYADAQRGAELIDQHVPFGTDAAPAMAIIFRILASKRETVRSRKALLFSHS